MPDATTDTAHTPGPWHPSENLSGYWFLYAADGGVPDDETVPVAEVYNRSRAEANARLISAAPDLLEAAERAEGVLADMDRGEAGDHVLSVLHAAIQRARGE